MMLKGVMRGGHPCLVPYLSRRTLSFSLLHMTLAEGFCRQSLSSGENSSLHIIYSIFIMNRCWILSNAFLHLLMWSCDVLFLVCWSDGLHWFLNAEPGLQTRDKFQFVMMCNPLCTLLDSIANILLRIIAYMFTRKTVLQLFSALI